LIALRLGLSQGTPLHADPLAMRRNTLPLLRQLLGWDVL
jgi:hypothetical protein